MKSFFTRLKNYGQVLACVLSLSSCAAIQVSIDQNKLQQLETDYHQGKVSKKDYKREKGRLQLEIRENQKLMGEVRAHPINPPMEDNGNQEEYGGGGDEGGYDDGSGKIVEEPYFVYENVYYYQYHGRYYYTDHGSRHFVTNLPAGGHHWSRSDGHPPRHVTGGPHRTGTLHQPPQKFPQGDIKHNGGGGSGHLHPQVGQAPAAVKGQQITNPKNGKDDKDKQH